ncbi:MAG: transcription antitermination factor NusB [Lachnospiraceae bacterium]|nr:transcription antitermination factor NusB [Lachnospiraceae bacterium]
MKRRELRIHLFKLLLIYSSTPCAEMDAQTDIYLDRVREIIEEDDCLLYAYLERIREAAGRNEFADNPYAVRILQIMREHDYPDCLKMEAEGESCLLDIYLDGIKMITEYDDCPDKLKVITEEDKKYIKKRFSALKGYITDIDDMLNRTAKGWSTNRFGSADLAILRVACYEMLFDDSIPESVAINEAVDIAKIYCGNESPAFINGILGNISSAGKAKQSQT